MNKSTNLRLTKGKARLKLPSAFCLLFPVFCLLLFAGCLTVSLSGSNIDPNAKTAYIGTFTNNTTLGSPTLSQDFTNALKNLVQRQTPLSIINVKNADYSLEGEIIGYTINPVAIQANDVAAMTRLTITVRVRFNNKFDPTQNFEQQFSRYVDYPSTVTSVASNIIEDINTALTEDIFNKAFVNW